MSNTRLPFEEPGDEIRPADDRMNPVLWIRRLVVVELLAPDVEPLREVEFRRGLNIIATARPEERTDGPVGHNVGKTLLTRLLRHCLGEQHFAREAVRPAIAAALPDAFVICEVFVENDCWVVARPIGTARATEARCLRSGDWRTILEETSGAERFATFVEQVEQATIARFAEILLPHANRSARWLDLLAWLSRDQYCRYRHPLEWRAAWTESGTTDLHNEDASILIRMVMDLLDSEEAELIRKHKQLLTNKNDKSGEVSKLEQRLSQTRRFLEDRLHIAPDLLTDDLFGETARGHAEGAKTGLQKQLDDLDEDSDWKLAIERAEESTKAVARKEQEIATRTADRQVAESELRQHESASSDDLAASLADLANPCTLPATTCPLKNPNQQPGSINPLRKMRIEQLTLQLQSLDQALAQLRGENVELVRQRDQAASKVNTLRTARRKKDQRIRSKLSVTDALIQEARDYITAQRKLQTAIGELARLERDIEQSRESHHSAHTQLAQRSASLNEHFNRALRSLVASDVTGAVRLDMRGLHLSFGDHESTLGEALATSETVLSLDIACLSAAISGLGFLPRFAIHDSPREADLEPHIYARLFIHLKLLEDAFGDRLPSFQYIVTTTTPPPPEMETEPYLRLVLDARQKDGLLLKKRF
jgi:hypothetical protein